MSCESWTRRKSGEWERKQRDRLKKKPFESERKREEEEEDKKKKKKQENICLFCYYCPWPEAQYPKGKYGFMLILQPSQSYPYHHRHQLPERNCNGVQGKEIITTGAKQE